MEQENPHLPIDRRRRRTSAKVRCRNAAQPTMFYSHRQMSETGMTLLVRASQPQAIAGAAVQAIRRLDPNLAVTRMRTFELALGESLARERLIALVSGAFALSGLLLASLGLYGLLAFLVAERTKEIGIRIALGAQVGRLTRSVVGERAAPGGDRRRRRRRRIARCCCGRCGRCSSASRRTTSATYARRADAARRRRGAGLLRAGPLGRACRAADRPAPGVTNDRALLERPGDRPDRACDGAAARRANARHHQHRDCSTQRGGPCCVIEPFSSTAAASSASDRQRRLVSQPALVCSSTMFGRRSSPMRGVPSCGASWPRTVSRWFRRS